MLWSRQRRRFVSSKNLKCIKKLQKPENKFQLGSNEKGTAVATQFDHSLSLGVAAGEQKEDENIAHHMTSSGRGTKLSLHGFSNNFTLCFVGLRILIYRAK